MCYNLGMIIVAQPIGQLGNRLILFAHLAAFAREHRLKIVNLAFEEYAPLFAATKDDLFCRYPPKHSDRLPRFKPTPNRRYWLRRIGMRLLREAEAGHLPPFVAACRPAGDQTFTLDAAFAETARRRVVLLGGWRFRRPDGLGAEAPAVRDYFRPAAPAEAAAHQFVQAARQDCDLLIGVHLRGGDYRQYREGRYFYTAAQYASFLARASALFAPRRVSFLLCSNAPLEADAFAGFPVSLGSGQVIEDLAALAGCDYLIGPPSAFTVWASFYGQVPLCHVTHPEMAFTHADFHLSQNWGGLFTPEAA